MSFPTDVDHKETEQRVIVTFIMLAALGIIYFICQHCSLQNARARAYAREGRVENEDGELGIPPRYSDISNTPVLGVAQQLSDTAVLPPPPAYSADGGEDRLRPTSPR